MGQRLSAVDQDSLDDPFGEYDPTESLALVASHQAQERARLARDLVDANLLANDSATNAIASSARKSAEVSVSKLQELADEAAACVDRIRSGKGSTSDVNDAIDAFQRSSAVYEEVQQIANSMLISDDPAQPVVDAPLPKTHSWSHVCAVTKADTLRWVSAVRGTTGKMLVLKPSPSAGKTETMIDVALMEQRNRQKVVFAARTKSVLEDELVPRIKKKNSWVKLHVIQGRNEDTCRNIQNVVAVQSAGYAPGRSVCFGCEHHPRNAFYAQVSICDYYQSRMRAQNDTAAARRGISDYPLILTTHSGYTSAQESGGGQYGQFWPHNLLLVDEDPTESFEPELIVSQKHMEYASNRPTDRAATVMAAMLRSAADLAAIERKAMAATKFRDLSGKPSPIHSRSASVYAGQSLHELLKRVATGAVGQQYGVSSVVQVLRDAADSAVQPDVGSLFGAATTDAVNGMVPPWTLSRLAEVIYDEISAIERVKRLIYKKVHGHELPVSGTLGEAERELEKRVAMFDTAYRSRLEYSQGEWKFVVQEFVDLRTADSNVIVGDAYAHIDHYRQLFDRPASKPNDPSWKDPVTVVSHTASFPDGTMLLRLETKASITYLNGDGWQQHAAKLGEILYSFGGKSVLIYGHRSLKEKVETLMTQNANFGVSEWAYEHWWGGRGKDGYKNFDAVVCISEPIQNIDGMLHKVNARSSKHASAAFASNDEMLGLESIRRITFDMKHSNLAHNMRASGTHWRIRQEHERQNINELAQALHRVRGLIAPKTMVVLGQEVELTRDTIAASIHVSETTGDVSSSLLEADHPFVLTAQEAVTAMLAIEDNLGVWSPAFLHAFFGVCLMSILRFPRDQGYLSPQLAERIRESAKNGGISRRAIRELLIIARLLIPPFSTNSPTIPNGSSDGYPPLSDEKPNKWIDPPETSSSDGDIQGGTPLWTSTSEVPLTLLERVWDPGPRWQLLNELAREKRARSLAVASGMAAEQFRYTGFYRPTWWGNQPGRGYAWYSNRSYTSGLKAFREIMEDQYGPMVDGSVFAPRRKPMVPF